ncbi:GMC family oxidoreductase N-terminal domain-containing protein [soil metagenome]
MSADSRKRVLLIEAGQQDNYHWIHIPVGYLYCIGNPRTDWMYSTEPDAGLNGRALRYPRGKVLGGSSSINGMIYMRGQARDYEHWGALGNPGWSWQECLASFKKHEDFYKGADEFHGAGDFDRKGKRPGHEWRVEKQRLRWDILDSFAKAAQQAGIPHSEDFNRGDNEGVGYFHVNQRSGVRWNASKAFLRPAYQRENLQLWTGAHLSRLLWNDGADATEAPRVVGVEILPLGGGEPIQAMARAEVILCAGAVNSPQILQLSGVGAAQQLAAHGIAVKRDLPGVGENLQDHLQIRTVFAVQGAKTLNTMTQSWIGKGLIGLEYMFKRSGPMSMAPSQLGAFTRSSPDQPWPNIEFHVQPLSLEAFGDPLHTFNAFTASVCNLNPTSRGTVRIQSADPSAAPLIRPNYLSTDADRQVAADSLRVARKIVAQPALAPYAPKELKPGAEFQTDAELAKLAGDIGTTIFHPVGTCRMGPASDPMAVVDSRLRVHGVAGLRVVDASVMPTITSGNTNSPTLMIAERAAAWIIEDNR